MRLSYTDVTTFTSCSRKFNRRLTMARIVDTDNFNGDYPGEKFLLWPMPRRYCQSVADALNAWAGPDAPRYYKVVEDDYQLRPGFER